jgi:hypothetical protein
MDEFHDDNGLADPRAPEHGSFASLRKRREEVDHLDAGFEYRRGRAAVPERWRRSMDWRARYVGRQRCAPVANISGDIEKPAEHGVSDRHRDWISAGAHRNAPPKTRSGLKRNPADGTLVEMGLHLDNEIFWPVPFDDQGFVERRQFGRLEGDIDDGATYSDDLSC